MFSQCISAVCVLGIVMVAMLIMTQVVSFEQVARGVGRAFLLLGTALVVLCRAKGLFVMVAVPALVLLKGLMAWLAVIALVVILVILIARILIFKFEWLPGRGNQERGEP
jgi:hypothetical protein